MKTSVIAVTFAIVGIAVGNGIQEIRKKRLERLEKKLERELTELLEG